MLKKLLISHLLLTAIVISFVLPTGVLGTTKDFYPRNENGWTGSVKIGSSVEFLEGDIYVGYSQGSFPTPNFTFRGYAVFDVTTLPDNACVSDIRLDANCWLAGSSTHKLVIKSMLNSYPVQNNASTLANQVRNGTVYNATASNGMRSTGPFSIILSYWAQRHLENAAKATGFNWFAVGFMEENEDDKTGITKGWTWNAVDGKGPVLHVTYTVPVQTAPVASTSADSVCIGESFQVSWNTIPGATRYEIQESGGTWIMVGTNTSRSFTKTQTGDFTFLVRGANSCGSGPASQSVSTKVIISPPAPANVIVPASSCTNSSYTVSWTPVAGVIGYQIREDNGAWINTGDTTQWTFIHQSAGMHNYSVRSVNMCGTGSFKTSPDFYVLDTPPAPAAPTASNRNPCPNDKVTISWPRVTNAIKYQLTESRLGIVYIGPLTSWKSTFASGSYEYRLAVDNGCGWSNFSRVPLSIRVKQQITAPEAPVSDREPAIVGETYTISWNAVPGATRYQLFERSRNGLNVLVYSGSDLKKKTAKGQAGIFTYAVKAGDDCGYSKMGAELNLTVEEITSVEEIDATVLPGSFALSQNYPNPFNPETRIEFSLKHAAYVELTVFNILGETIRTLVNDNLSVGFKAVSWDGRDESGRSVSSGVYLYKLTAGDFSETKKMMLVK